MIILGFESSAKAASAAICSDGVLVAQTIQASGLTHSKTLLPLAEDLLKNCGMTFADVDALAVAHGPGSFTGIRIGVSIVKGLCWGLEKPAVGVSTLEAMAWNGECAPEGSIVCCAMDARRAQVYNALFSFENGKPCRVTKDRAIGLTELADELRALNRPVFVLGDGAELCYNYLQQSGLSAMLAPQSVRLQSAWGVCRAAAERTPVSGGELLPVYLRLSQAERERLERMKKE
ncbi:MAG: tRNA (adenosine(37)-N6)-threonylcarbamoyltransferase complex dimerization subunit type 1 TsaB [Ruminococcaceae bacterium]|nr:tRNA (adenosine(37)-N6)-threonylcarbamoyltransferase complex dimerization subunit type 1 TsaB [Oscillospiraceae bacterium]